MTDNILESIKNIENYHIVNSNFRDKYNDIESKLKSAAVISIDSEFSGLTLQTKKLKNSLFDQGAERYNIVRTNIEGFIIIQVGLTAFCFNRDSNRYEAHMFNFFLFPKSISSIDLKFSCQASSLQFLANNSFDFNKFIYEGIPFLNEDEEKILQKELSDGKLLQQVERNVPLEDEKELLNVLSTVTEWSKKSKVGEEFTLNDGAEIHNEILVYLIHKEIRKRCSDLWTERVSSKVVVKKVDTEEKKLLEATCGDSLEKDILEYFLGFSRIFRLLVSLKKPIVGHNLFIDLLIMYKQFYKPLPIKYRTFKKDIYTMFPKLFDTKYISYELKRVLKKEDAWVSNAVLDLYNYFSEGKGREATMYRPIVKLWMNNIERSKLDILLHEAGWDSYISGYCFIQMGHYFACANYGPDGYRRPLSSTEHINGVAQFMNHVNIVRASISYVNFSGDDPPSNRPPTLLVRIKGKSRIDLTEVTTMLAKYCSVDIRALDDKSALVAVSNYSSARNILKDYLKHEKYKVTLYHPIRDSKIVRLALWSGLIFSSGLCVGAIIRVLMKK